MTGYIAGRILQGLINILFITVLVFVLARASGDPLEAFLPDDASVATIELIRERLGFDEPLHVQYWIFFKGLMVLDLGESKILKEPVTKLLVERLPATFSLAAVAMAHCHGDGPAPGSPQRRIPGYVDRPDSPRSLPSWGNPAPSSGLPSC